ncbi:MAG: SAV_2336 N-terminal domain-related protein [Cyanobacteria bacterium P01_G01_bin.54]
MMDDRLFKMLAQLRETDEPLSAIEIADMVWFAAQLRRKYSCAVPPDPTPARPKQESNAAPQPLIEETPEEPTSLPVESEPAPVKEAIVTPPKQQPGSKAKGLPFSVPAAKAIPQARSLGRALRPLNRKVPSRTTQVIDAAATINRVAEERVLMPVLKPAPERWLDVALVIEKTESYGIWQQTIAEFEQILLHQGAFRDVRRWYAEPQAGALQLKSRQETRRSPKELIRAGGQRLIFVVSDCLDATWHNGAWQQWCSLWGQHHGVLVVQMLPPNFWRRTRLRQLEAVWLKSQRVGPLNHQWQQVSRTPWQTTEAASGFVVPVCALEPYALAVWAQGMAGNSATALAGYQLAAFEPAVSGRESLSAQERFELFMQRASAPAKRLAALMSAVPVQLPIVRLIQRTMLRQQASTTQVAEIFLSGIVERRGQAADPEQQLYEFVADEQQTVRALLNKTLPKSEIALVIDRISADIAQRANKSIREFQAMLMAPGEELSVGLATEVSEFARVTLAVLKRLGGEYEAFAEGLEQGAPPNPQRLPKERLSSGLLIEPYTYEAVSVEVIELEAKIGDFYRACNPANNLNYTNEYDRHLYIDFSEVRGREVVSELENTITWSEESTCQLFTGHIGCGRSTELLCLKARLEAAGWHVTYFESSQMLEMWDVEISDILLAIAHQVSLSLQAAQINLVGGYFEDLFNECNQFLQTPIELGAEAEVSLWGIGKLIAKAKQSPTLRSQLRQYLEPQTQGLIKGINQAILEPATQSLQQQGKEGLVIIIDNLDRIENRIMEWGKTLPEYLFAERGQQLRQLDAHLVYTIPLMLRFSDKRLIVEQRLGEISILPMVPVRWPDGMVHREGLAKLQEMILARALPELPPENRPGQIPQLFDDPTTLEHLCLMSGGHLRNLLRYIQSCLRRSKQLPIQRSSVDQTLQQARAELMLSIAPNEWTLLRKVHITKALICEEEYDLLLLRSLWVFEYRTNQTQWFELNPLLANAHQLQDEM